MNGYEPRKRAKVLTGSTHKIETGCGHLYISVNRDEEGIFEIFAHLGKNGNCGAAQLEAICRSVTAGLRAHVDPRVFVRQFGGIQCMSHGFDEGKQVLSCADAIAKVLQKEIDGTTSNTVEES